MMGTQVERRPTALQPFDQRDVPRRTLRVERDRLEQPHEVEHLARRPGRGHRQRPEVGLHGRIVVVDPGRAGPYGGRVVGSLPQPRGLDAANVNRSTNASWVGGRSTIKSAPRVILSVASCPTRHMIASIGVS